MELADDLLAKLVERVEHRYYGKYRAFVEDNADPEKRGRLRLRIPAVLGPDIVSGWALPCAPYGGMAGQGFFFIPENDAGVWVEFEAGTLEYPVWVGTFWSKPGGTTEVPPPADAQQPPTSKVLRTTKHTIELADEDGSEAIIITDETNKNTITIDKDGILIEDANQNTVTMASSGVTVEDANGNTLALESGGVTITSSAIKIGGGAAEKLVKGDKLASLLDSFQTALLTHTHTGNLGAPTSPPTPPLTPQVWTTALSTKHSVE